MSVCLNCTKEFFLNRLLCPNCGKELINNVSIQQVKDAKGQLDLDNFDNEENANNYFHSFSSFYKEEDLRKQISSIAYSSDESDKLMRAVFGLYSFPFKELLGTFADYSCRTISNVLTKKREIEINDIKNTLHQILDVGINSFYKNKQKEVEKEFFKKKKAFKFKNTLKNIPPIPIKPRKEIPSLTPWEKLLLFLFPKTKNQKINCNEDKYTKLLNKYESQYGKWQIDKKNIEVFNKKVCSQDEAFATNLAKIEKQEELYIVPIQDKRHILKIVYDGKVERFYEEMLSFSPYPKVFKKKIKSSYDLSSRLLLLNFWLPTIEELPTIESYNFIMTRNEFTEKKMSQKKINELYDSLIYQICLRTIYEVFQLDKFDNLIDAVVFNGRLNFDDPRTGKKAEICLLSIRVSKKELKRN